MENTQLTIDELRRRFPDQNGFSVSRSKTQTRSFTGRCQQAIWFVINGALEIEFGGDASVRIEAGQFAGLPTGRYRVTVVGDAHVEYAQVRFRKSKGNTKEEKGSD